MQYQKLGGSPLSVSKVGVGCYSMTSSYGKADAGEAVNTIHRAIELGVNFFDTADSYANGANEKLVGRALKGKRQSVVLASKFGQFVRGDGSRAVSGHPDYVRRACEASLQRLQTDYVDLYYQHRVDKEVPIEDTVGEMGRLQDEGKIRAIGLSEASPNSIKKAQAQRDITALQIEYSLWTRFIEEEHLPLCNNLEISVVGYAPIGRGFLSGTIRTVNDLAKDEDSRKNQPRFYAENIKKNVSILKPIEELAVAKNCTMAQLAIAWCLSGNDKTMIALPGISKRLHLEENIKSLEIELNPDERNLLSGLIDVTQIAGDRYPPGAYERVNV